MRASLFTSALVAALVGFGGTLAVILAAAKAAGADGAQAASWVTGLCLAMAATSAILSWRHRMPIVTAWSTPGAVLIAAAEAPPGMQAAVGAFILAGVLIVLTAAVTPLGNLVARIPASIASAMLAGVLLRFVLPVFDSAQAAPWLVLPLVLLFLVLRVLSPVSAVLAVLAAGVGLAAVLGRIGPLPGWIMPQAALVVPRFDPVVVLGLGVPLYLVTMASQNLPGFAVLRSAGYAPPVRSILATTGLASVATALIGAHTSNLAAITAALVTGPDTHPDPARRWPAGVFYGACYLVFAVLSGVLVALFAALPPELIRTVAGLALMTPLMGALAAALGDEARRFPAVLTLAVTASGVAPFSIGSAFWGLAAGLLATGLDTGLRSLKTRDR